MAALRYKPLDHPSDVGIIAFGKNNEELFTNAAFGMFSVMADLETVQPQQSFRLKVSGTDPESLLINWLNELIYLEDSRKFLFSEFKIDLLTAQKLEATVRGEKIDLARHTVFRPIKAATYNQLQILPGQATIVFDV